MRYQLRQRPTAREGAEQPLIINVVDNDGKVVAEGHLVANYVPGEPNGLIICGVQFEGIHKATS